MLSSEQAKKIKGQLLKQLEALPESQREELQEQIEKMSDSQLEEFLVKNNMIRSPDSPPSEIENHARTKCTFCLLSQEKLQSYKLDESKQAIAILEINPISKGHAIIIPKKHIEGEKMPSQAFSLAKKIGKKIKSKLKPKKIDFITSQMFSHGIINVLPIYSDENLGSQRSKASESELISLQKELEFKKAEKKPKKEKGSVIKTVGISKLPKAPKRFP